MFLSELRVEGFRMFGEGEHALVLPLRPGLTALVGENDTGKTAVVDALRLALGTRDQDSFRVEEEDFHQPPDAGQRSSEIRIRCKFKGLTRQDRATFVEYLTYEDRGEFRAPVLYINWQARNMPRGTRSKRSTPIEIRSGEKGDGPQIDWGSRSLLSATYLRPLRDAQRAMSAGRGSRLSQILQNTQEVRESGQDYDPMAGPPSDLKTLSVLGIGDLADALLASHTGIQAARDRLNTDSLSRLSFNGAELTGHISVGGAGNDANVRFRQLLEKLDLELRDAGQGLTPNRGLGSNNLLFMACELLLLGTEEEGFPLVLIEEPEAHLHPQRQLRLVQFLQTKSRQVRHDGQKVQVLITTHSPNLASALDLDNLVLLHGGKAFPLTSGQTHLSKSDYGFLGRFLDVTKANLFFARGLMIVEGDAENILIPTLARLIGKDLAANGVSIVNVGGTGLRRFARIYMRKDPGKGVISVPVACVADLDVMPACAATLLHKAEAGQSLPEKEKRRWRVRSDYSPEALEDLRKAIEDKASGQSVRTFVADEWTFEYDLAFGGLGREVWTAASLAEKDEQICSGRVSIDTVKSDADRSFEKLQQGDPTRDMLASLVYAPYAKGSVSKATGAQYLANVLEDEANRNEFTAAEWRARLPKYLVDAIDYVTSSGPSVSGSGVAHQ